MGVNSEGVINMQANIHCGEQLFKFTNKDIFGMIDSKVEFQNQIKILNKKTKEIIVVEISAWRPLNYNCHFLLFSSFLSPKFRASVVSFVNPSLWQSQIS